MTSDRTYRRGMSHEAACEELRREAGRQFDAKVVDALLRELSADGHSEPVRSEPSALTSRAAEVAASLRKVLVRSAPEGAGPAIASAPSPTGDGARGPDAATL